MFTATDLKQLSRLGITTEQVQQQLKNFRKGFPFLSIVAPATLQKGIIQLNKARQDELIAFYEKWNGSRLKFVSASGAADDDSPKGVLPFHTYPEEARTALEEHLVEAAMYAKDTDNAVRLHFTVFPKHRSEFKKLLKKVQKNYEKRFGVQFEINVSEQKKSTDIIVADEGNKPFRNTDGSLLFHSGGHGALLENLNDIQDDIVFIKNIDNVVSDAYKEKTAKWKKILAGMLLQLQKQIGNYIAAMESGEASVDFYKIRQFLETNFCIKPPHIFDSDEEYETWLYKKLNRPLRVCGMVKKAGKHKEIPFIVKNKDGSHSLQIAESLQINMKKDMQKLADATHFNPVDLVCSFRDYKGGKFDLRQFSNPATGIISTRNEDGKIFKLQELPGLWNGTMSDWNTMFVEMPPDTINPAL